MNFTKIEREYPEAYAQFEAREARLARPTDFFDSLRLYVLPTYHAERFMPWGWQLYTPDGGFINHDSAYVFRESAIIAGWEQAFSELNRLILAGNA